MPTKKKDSTSTETVISDSEPALCACYRQAIKAVCGRFVRIKDTDYPKFLARQRQLTKEGEAFDTYAYTVVKEWWPWCSQKKMGTVPVGIFCGPKAWSKYVSTRKHVRIESPIDTDWNILVHNEMNAARIYIGAALRPAPMSIARARELSKGELHPSQEVIDEVVRLLNLLYARDAEAETYDEIYQQIQPRKDKITKNIVRTITRGSMLIAARKMLIKPEEEAQ